MGWAACKSLPLHGVASAGEVMHAILMQERVREDRGSIACGSTKVTYPQRSNIMLPAYRGLAI